MIGTIRKHSNWLWYPIIIATIITFVLWGAGQALFTSQAGGNFGSVYGKKVTRDQYLAARANFYLSYWMHSEKWPDEATMPAKEMDQQIYVTMMLLQKAEQLGIHVDDQALAKAMADRLQMFGRNGQTVPLDSLVQQVLAPKGFTAADFATFVRNDLTIQELIQTIGLPGGLVTPQAAAAAYQRESEELATRAVFFSASNYLSFVKATPQAVAQYYTNFQADYRLKDRVQIDYVAFEASNYLARSRAEWAKTNLADYVDNYLHKLGENYKGSTNADQARAKITEDLVEQRAVGDARVDANDLAGLAFSMEPARAENLATVAKQKGLAVHETAPFSEESGPAELDDAVNFTKTAFALTADSPLAGPVIDGNTVYVLALARSLPSEIPPLEEIRARVTADFENRSAIRMAQQAGAIFEQVLTNQLAAGKSFVSICAANGHTVESLPPFSIGTKDLPELGDHVELAEFKQTAFTTPLGKTSPLEPARDGAFILYVESKLPPDQAQMKAMLPQFTQNLRRTLENEAFNEWYNTEANAHIQLPPQDLSDTK